MKMSKKIGVICLLICLFVACEERFTSTIPNASVNLTIDLIDEQLILAPSYKEYIKPEDTSFPLATDRFGFGGILVVHGFGMNSINLYVYDLACPNEAQSNVRVKPQDHGLQAKCPECGAVYDIANGWGNPISGSEYGLRRYNIGRISETRYRITN